MFDASCCHSCGTEVDSDMPRCPMCYVALEAASRAPSPLRAAASAVSRGGALARVAETAVMEEPPWAVGVQCPSCEATVTPITGWCSYCMEPLPVEGSRDRGPHAQIIAGPWPARSPATVITGPRRQRAVAALLDASVVLPGLVALVFSMAAGAVLLCVAMIVTAWHFLWLQPRWGTTVGQHLVDSSRHRRRAAHHFR